MSSSDVRVGLTLLEVLAAIVLLGVLVAAVTPLLLRIGASTQRWETRLTAENLLSQAVTERFLAAAVQPSGTQELTEHPGWSLHWQTLQPSITSLDDPTRIRCRWLSVRLVGPPGTPVVELVVPAPTGPRP